jgi:hypothetical protein
MGFHNRGGLIRFGFLSDGNTNFFGRVYLLGAPFGLSRLARRGAGRCLSELDHALVKSGQVGYDEADPWYSSPWCYPTLATARPARVQ